MRAQRIAVVFACASALGCGQPGTASKRSQRPSTGRVEPAPEPVPTPPKLEQPQFRVLTFNAGLAVGVVADALERAPGTIRAIASSPADLVCVQEVWLDEHWEKLVQATRERWPQAMRAPASSGTSQRCSPSDLNAALSCVERSCKPGSGLALCAISSCRSLVNTLSSDCVACLTRDPLRSLEQIRTDCSGADAPAAARTVKKKSTPRVYGGSSGIGLLTRAEVIDRDFLPLDSEGVTRGVLYAKVRAPAPVHELAVFCTHLTTDLGVPYTGRAGSWKDQQRREVDALLAWSSKRAGDKTPTVVLGDLNTGPAGGNAVRPLRPEHYALFVREGFVNPYLEHENPPCTFCYDNPLIANGRGGVVIDHVLVKNVPVSVSAVRVFDEPVELAVGARQVRSRYSDHYGVLAVLGVPGS